MANTALKDLKEDLHLSHSQIFSYLNCSLKYYFSYVVKEKAQHTSIPLPFGSAIHAALERYYLTLKESGAIEPLDTLQDLFSESLALSLKDNATPALFKKDMPDEASAILMGKSMLEAFYQKAPDGLKDMEIVEVEYPLSATLYDQSGEPTDLKLIGVIDLLLRDKNGFLIAVDHKTAAKPYVQADVDKDLQLSAYSYLLAANRHTFPTAAIQCRFDVLRKLKRPKLEHYHTIRTGEHRKRFSKIATAVLTGIENQIFIPTKSWMCGDCPYSEACEKW